MLSGLIKSNLTFALRLKQSVLLTQAARHIQEGHDQSGHPTYRLEQPGEKVEGAEDLDKAIKLLQELLETHQKGWPRDARLKAEEVFAAYGRGEYQDLTDAFATAAGVDREEWVRRVEKRKSERQASKEG
jgi:hypothetical protein